MAWSVVRRPFGFSTGLSFGSRLKKSNLARALRLFVQHKFEPEHHRRILLSFEGMDSVELAANDHKPEQKNFALTKQVFLSWKILWIEFALEEEVAGVDLGDNRLSRRLAIIIDQLGVQPTLSIPAAMHGRIEMEAAYRFFANKAVTPNAILSTHYAMTRQRIALEKDCLLVQTPWKSCRCVLSNKSRAPAR